MIQSWSAQIRDSNYKVEKLKVSLKTIIYLDSNK